jgi:hypothetical protein
MADAAQQLQEAFELIENGNLQAARELLDDIRPQNEDNPDFWWVYSHALEDGKDGRDALSRVQELAPNYPGLEQLEEQAGLQAPRLQSLKPLNSPPPSLPMEEDVAAKKQGGIRNWLTAIGGFAVLAIIIIGIAFVSGIFGGDTTSEPTSVVEQNTLEVVNTAIPTVDAAAATDEPSEEATIAATDEPSEIPPTVTTEPATATIEATEAASLEPTAIIEPTEAIETDPFAELYGELESFGVLAEGITTEQTTMGNSFIVDTCSNPGPAANNNILGVMDTLVTANIGVPDDIEAMTFNIVNCDTNTVTLALGINRDTVLAYLAGELSQSELLQALRRVG